MNICEKSAYLTGLLDGKNLDMTKAENLLISELVKLVKEMAEEITDLQDMIDELHKYIEEIDEDLGMVEEDLYIDDDEDDYYDDEDEDDQDFYEVDCPACGEVVCFDSSVDPDDVTCPACGEKFSCLCDGDCDCCEDDCEE